MSTEVKVPTLGESVTEATIGQWFKKAGDRVEQDETIAELETDKITVELPSPVAGALSEQRFAVGATVKVGDVIGAVEAGKAGKAAPAKQAAQPAKQPAAQPAAQVSAQPAAQASAQPAAAQPAARAQPAAQPAAAPARP